jgi:hypothetical protein
MSRSRVILAIFSVTAFLIFSILLRTSSTRTFNEYRGLLVEQKKLSRQLWQKQLSFEQLVNPAGLPEITGSEGQERQGHR